MTDPPPSSSSTTSTSSPSPLRDRLPTNTAPDSLKSSILRESGHGWSSTAAASITSPLRIPPRASSPSAKTPRQSVHALPARRSSNSYRHVRANNLVSKSPFKSLLPTPTATPTLPFPASPSPRRVSGEKRPRPTSLHDQQEAENARPFALKRERRQSKGFQGLMQKEPVTRSPFRRQPPEDLEPESKPLPAPPPQPSPPRSSLVSKRLHGPRTTTKRARRKTVTFDERCDVVEFEADDNELGDPFDEDEDAYGEEEDMADATNQDQDQDQDAEGDVDEEYMQDHQQQSLGTDRKQNQEHNAESEQERDQDSFESIELSAPAPSTPPHSREPSLPPGLDAEDGVPYGRTHHRDRARAAHQAQSTPPPPRLPSVVLPQQPQTPPQRQADPRASDPPLGRSTHAERHRADVKEGAGSIEAAVRALPPSPSPAKPPRATPDRTAGLLPRFGINLPRKQARVEGGDPFALEGEAVMEEQIKDEPLPAEISFASTASFEAERSFPSNQDAEPSYTSNPDANRSYTSNPEHSFVSSRDADPHDRSYDPLDFSIGHSEVSLSVLEAELGLDFAKKDEQQREKDALLGLDLPTPETASESSAGYTTASASSPPLPEPTGLPEEEVKVPSRIPVPVVRAESPAVRTESPALRADSPATRAGSPFTRVEATAGRTSSPAGRTDSPLPHHVVSTLPTRTSSPLPPRIASPATRIASPLPSRVVSPLPARVISPIPSRLASPLGSASPSGSARGRLRISREEVQRRLLRKRSADSPGLSVGSKDGESVEVEDDISLSAESATIQCAEKRTMPVGVGVALPSPPAPLQFDFGVKFGGGGEGGSVDVDMRSALDRLLDDVAAGSVSDRGGQKAVDFRDGGGDMKVEAVTEGVQAGRFVPPEDEDVMDNSMMTEDADNDEEDNPFTRGPQRAATDSALLPSAPGRTVSGSTIPPPPPPKEKDAIRNREEMILEKRREARRREEGESMGYLTPPRLPPTESNAGGRPSRRRSRSTGDVGGLLGERGRGLLDGVPFFEAETDPLEDSINRELRKLGGASKTKYQVREREGTIYASSVEHVGSAGDVDGGKAWRTVRRPSDMNEYSKQIKEYRAQEKPGKAHGKVFVKVVGVKGLNVPLPQQPTAMTCTLNNGIHFVTTPECKLARDCRIEQEFELIEHSKLEFTLTLKVRRDPHIIAQFKAIAPPPPQPPPLAPTSSKGGMRAFFSSSPKKSKSKQQEQTPPPPPPPPDVENLARYLKPDGLLARAFISFRDVASRCDTRLFETSYPLIGQRVEPGAGGKAKTAQVGELVLQMFRLPPLPGVAPEQLPQSLEECHRGLRHVAWHKVTYFEGTLTQNGGDCTTWRRRQLRVVGANLVAFNDVTKKATATIDIRKAIAVEDDQAGMRADVLSPASTATGRSGRYGDDYEGLYGVERSFRLVFPHDQEIVFFADTDEEKAKWLEVLRALVGHIPPNPLWAELTWQRQQELSKQGGATTQSRSRDQTR